MGEGCLLHRLTASNASEEDEAEAWGAKSSAQLRAQRAELLLCWHSLGEGGDVPQLGAHPISRRSQTASIDVKIKQVEQVQIIDNVGTFRAYNTHAGSGQNQQ